MRGRGETMNTLKTGALLVDAPDGSIHFERVPANLSSEVRGTKEGALA